MLQPITPADMLTLALAASITHRFALKLKPAGVGSTSMHQRAEQQRLGAWHLVLAQVVTFIGS
jgi:hypothetical protein